MQPAWRQQYRFIGGVFWDLSTLLPFVEAAFPHSSLSVSSSHWDGGDWGSQASVIHHTLAGEAALASRLNTSARLWVCVGVHAGWLSDVHIYPKSTVSPNCPLAFSLIRSVSLTHTHTHSTYVFHRCKEVTHRRVPWDRLGFGFKVIFSPSLTDLWFSVFPHISSVTDCLSHLRANRTINPQIFAHQLMIYPHSPLRTNVFVKTAVLSTYAH